VFVLQCGLGAIEAKPFPVANPGLKLDAEQVGEPEDRRALALRVGVDRIRPRVRIVLRGGLLRTGRINRFLMDQGLGWRSCVDGWPRSHGVIFTAPHVSLLKLGVGTAHPLLVNRRCPHLLSLT
jgi:hypothetical protein